MVLVVNGLSFGQHALVQDADNEDTAGLLQPVEHDVLALFHAAQAWTNVITGSA